jgi:hypothetical protein
MSYDGRSEPDLYRFPDFILKVSGAPSPVREAVSTLFRFLPNAKDGCDRQIEMHVWDLLDDGSTVLPVFLSRYLANPDAVAEPTMVQGENVSIGFIHAHDGVFTACYYMPKDSRIEFVATRRSIGKTPLCITSVLVPLLREVLLDYRRALFHSAALACPDGTGILLFADSGGGKTTVSLCLMRLGAKLLGDDLVMIGEEEESLILYGFPEPLNLTEQTMTFFTELNHLKCAATSHGDKTVVSPKDVYGPLCFQEKVPLHVAYVLRRSDGDPHVELLPPQESLGIMVRAHTFARCQNISRHAIDRMYQILESTSFYRLHTGNNPPALGKWLLDSVHDHKHGRFSGGQDY